MDKKTRDIQIDLEYHRKMLEIYLNTEKQFLEFNEWVPMETNKLSVNSPRLYSLLITSCGQVEALMKKICESIDIIPKKKNFPEYYKILNSQGMLGLQSITVYNTGKNFRPFNENNEEHFWWKSHNDAKHELPEGILKGTIENVLYALAAINILQKIFLSIPLDDDAQKILDPKYWMNTEPIKTADAQLHPERYSSPYGSKIFLNENSFYWTGL